MTSDESGGTSVGRGTVTFDDCAAVLREGDSFVVALEAAFTVPVEPSAVEFTYSALSFDTTDPSFINDAFEVALVDVEGNSLVRNFAAGRDAFFNVTEGLSSVFGEGIVLNGNTVTVGLSGLPSGTAARLIVRLVNNDSDTLSSVAISQVAIVASELLANAPQNDPFALQRSFANLTSLQLAATQHAATRPIGPVTIPAGQPFTPPPVTDPKPLSPVLEWSWTSSDISSDSLNVMMTPAVIDLDGDGKPEIVFASTESRGGGYVEVGQLRAIHGDTGEELFTVNDPALAINAVSSVAVGDIDLDGLPEIIANDPSGLRLIAFEHDGTFKWLSPDLEYVYWGSPSIADLDADGVPEIVIGRQVLNDDGTIRWTGAAGRGDNSSGPLSLVADINLDGSPDIVAGNTVYNADGSIQWSSLLAAGDGFNAVGNFDNDPLAEIVLVTLGTVSLLDTDGSVIWGPIPIPGGGSGGRPPLLTLMPMGSPRSVSRALVAM